MLSLGPSSTCDVCLEPFGPESKGPCSIQCGHVFCVDCLHQLTYPHDADCQRSSSRSQCPLCRTPFDSSSIVKLHIDTENTQKGSPKAQAPSATAAEQDARRLQDAIAVVANSGSSEANLRALIEECRKFLAGQPRSMFPELRITHRMIAYLCEVKANLLSQTQACNALQSQVDRLEIEKGDLEKRIQELKETRRYERQTALTVEKSLRDHCSRAHEAYETVVDQYNFVVQEWMRLQQEVRHLQMPPTPQCPEFDSPDMDVDPDLAKTPQPRPMAELDQRKLQSAAVRDPESYLISPLPQFTGRLPEAVSLPDEGEQRQRLETKRSPRKQGSQLSFQSFVLPPTPSARDCGAPGHPYTCDCVEFAIFNEGAKKPELRRSSTTNTSSTPAVDARMPVPPSTPSSYPTPMMSPGRARSHTIPSHSSRPPSRASSPKPCPSNDVRDVYSPSSNSINIQGKGTESLKSRLHDLLQDNAGVSSSLPNMSPNHFPPSLTRATPQPAQKVDLPSRPSSRSGTSPSQHRANPLLSPKQGVSERSGASPQVSASYVAPSTPSVPPVPPAPVFSRASNAAMAIEKERKEKKEQERERRRLEKEKKRASGQETPLRPNSVSNAPTAAVNVSPSSYIRQNGSSGRESTGPYPPQRNLNANSAHGPGSVMPSTVYS